MKFPARKMRKLATLAAVSSAVLLASCATSDQNMAASRKEHLVAGKQLHVADQGDSFVFCEVALINGTSKANAIADFYNSTGSDI